MTTTFAQSACAVVWPASHALVASLNHGVPNQATRSFSRRGGRASLSLIKVKAEQIDRIAAVRRVFKQRQRPDAGLEHER